MDDRIEGVERRTASWRRAEPEAGSGDGGVPLVYVALYSQILDNLAQRWHGSVPEHLVFFLHSMSELKHVERSSTQKNVAGWIHFAGVAGSGYFPSFSSQRLGGLALLADNPVFLHRGRRYERGHI